MLTSHGLLRSAIGAMLLPLTALHAQVSRQRVDTAFTFERGGSVQLGLVSGTIRVIAGPGNEIRILATTERGRLETSLSRSRVSIEARSVGGRMGETRYELTVPVGTRVTAQSVSGDITVRGTEGEVEATSVSGDVTVESASGVVELGSVSGGLDGAHLAGRVHVTSVSGDIELDGVGGELETSTVSGSIGIRRGTLRTLRAESVSGDLSYDGALAADADYRLNTHSGTLFLAIPANAGAVLELETFSGDITSDFPLTLQPGDDIGRRRKRMQFTIGTGGARISAESFSGNITIRRAPARDTKE